MRNSLIAAMQEEPVKAQTTPDNLTAINGIGEVREQQLYELGIYTYAQLVDADPVALAPMLGKLVQPSMVVGWQEQAAELAL